MAWLGNLFEQAGTKLGLPEMGVSEFLSGQPRPTSSFQTPLTQPLSYQATPQEQALSQAMGYGYGRPQVPGQTSQTGGFTRGGSTGGQPGQVLGQQTGGDEGYYMSTPQQPSGPDYNQLAQSAWDALMESYNAQEQNIRGAYPVQKAQTEAEYGQSATEAETAKAKELGALGEQRTATGQTEVKNIADARRLYNEMKQQRLAELSAAGLTSSSVAEGGLEMLGRSLYQQMGSVRQSAADTYRKIAAAEAETNRDYGDYARKLEIEKNRAIETATLDFNQSLANIASQRGQATTDFLQKQAQARLDSLNQYRQQLSEVEKYNSQMKLALDQWAVERQNTMSQIKNRIPTTISTEQINQTLKDLQAQGFNVSFSGTPATGGGGYYNPSVSVKSKTTTDDDDWNKLSPTGTGV